MSGDYATQYSNANSIFGAATRDYWNNRGELSALINAVKQQCGDAAARGYTSTSFVFSYLYDVDDSAPVKPDVIVVASDSHGKSLLAVLLAQLRREQLVCEVDAGSTLNRSVAARLRKIPITITWNAY